MRAGTPPATPVRVFLDCDDCDFSFIRREAAFVDYVRNLDEADVYVLVTNRKTGSGGDAFTLAFLGRGRFAGLDQTLTHISPPDATDDDEREGLLRILKLGLISYAARSPRSTCLDVIYSAPTGSASTSTPAADPWNAWVFDVDVGGSFTKEEQQSEYQLDVSLSATRVTEPWKIETEADVQYEERNFERTVVEDDLPVRRTITSRSEEYDLDGRVVRARYAHWSADLFAQVASDTRFNNALSASLQPALEYSVFPYDVSERKELTIGYYVGVEARDYFEETLYQRSSEVLASQRLRGRLRFTQPWGEASVRIYRGLSAFFSIEAERIRDQLFLPRGDASLEDLLLERRQLATGYELSGAIGLSFTFGSIYNNVVNTRL